MSTKKRSFNDLDFFQKEESLIHKLSESNSAYIKFSSAYVEIPFSPIGKEKELFKVGDVVTNGERSCFKPGLLWKIYKVTKQGGFYSHWAKIILTPEQIKKKKPETDTHFRQEDIKLVSRLELKPY